VAALRLQQVLAEAGRQVDNGDGDAEILECPRCHDRAPDRKGAAADGSLRHKISRGRGYIVVEIQVSLKASASTLWRCADLGGPWWGPAFGQDGPVCVTAVDLDALARRDNKRGRFSSVNGQVEVALAHFP
jgi:hypothetical protein